MSDRLGLRRSVLIVLFLAGTFLAGPVLSASSLVTVTSPDGLNLRAAPNTSAAVLITIPLGSVLAVLGDPTPDQWYPVSFGGTSGWAYGAYLTAGQIDPTDISNASPIAANVPLTPPAPPSSTALFTTGAAALNHSSTTGNLPLATAASTPNATAGATMTVNSDALNIRTAPSSSATVITSVPRGTTVQVTGAAVNNWLPIQLNGLSGWMDSAFLANAASGADASAGTLSMTRSSAPLSAAMFGNPTLGTPAGPEADLTVAVAPSSAKGKFIWPVTARRITTTFKEIHQAIDIDQFPAGGNPAVATADGIVSYAGGTECCSYGLYVIVQHANGYSSLYSHLSKVGVSQGQLVHQGDQLGLTGNTGNSTGPHIHFAIYLDGNPLDPLTVLPAGADIYPGA